MYRSNMMLNPLNTSHLEKIPDIQAGIITLNLEDGISPERKHEALLNISNFLDQQTHKESQIVVRINPLDMGGTEEIALLNQYKFLGFRLPKVISVKQIRNALDLISSDKELHISLETKEAFYNIRDWKIDDRFTTANLGILDLLTSLGIPQSILQLDNPTINHILSKVLIDCHSVGLKPVGFMFQEYQNLKLFEQWCQKESDMGFKYKACMGPKQVQIANKIFAPSDYQITRARSIVEMFEKESSNQINGFMSDKYGFIDEPIYRDALLILRDMAD